MVRYTVRESKKINDYVKVIEHIVKNNSEHETDYMITFIHPSFRQEINKRLKVNNQFEIVEWGPLGNNISQNNGLPYQSIKIKFFSDPSSTSSTDMGKTKDPNNNEIFFFLIWIIILAAGYLAL
jgi:hypothetical protein